MTRSPWTGHIRSFDGLRIACHARGRGEPALLFIHGWCCNRHHWDAQAAAFEHEHRVVLLDLGGHGQSGRDRQTWRVQDYARDVQAAVDHFHLKRVILIGHSMGGPVSLLAAARMPDRVIGVIGVDTLHDADLVPTEEMMAPFLESLEKDFEEGMEQFVRDAFPEGVKPDPALVERLVRDATANDPKMAIGIIRSFLDYDPRTALANCPAPVRCINAAVPRETKVGTNRKYAPSFDVLLMHGVGHFPMLERPEEFNRHLAEQLSLILAND